MGDEELFPTKKEYGEFDREEQTHQREFLELRERINQNPDLKTALEQDPQDEEAIYKAISALEQEYPRLDNSLPGELLLKNRIHARLRALKARIESV